MTRKWENRACFLLSIDDLANFDKVSNSIQCVRLQICVWSVENSYFDEYSLELVRGSRGSSGVQIRANSLQPTVRSPFRCQDNECIIPLPKLKWTKYFWKWMKLSLNHHHFNILKIYERNEIEIKWSKRMKCITELQSFFWTLRFETITKFTVKRIELCYESRE